MLDKSLYTTILCQTFSPCGKYLIAGNIYNQIAVFDLDRILNPVVELMTVEHNKPKVIHTLENSHRICSLASTENFLIAGTESQIFGWIWKSVTSMKIGKPSWVIKLSLSDSAHEQFDVNSLWVSEDEETLYVGCGDNNVYSYNLENGQRITSYKGHEDYVHSVHGKENQLISAGEDGFVYMWDSRTGKSSNHVEPYKNSKVARPDIGKWVGAVSLNGDWFVCGGGPSASLWHLRSLDATTVFNIPDRGVHVALFNDDCVVIGGASKHLYQMSYSGEVKVELPVSATTTYSVLMRTKPSKLLTIAGSSPYIDLCTTFNYKDQILSFR